MPTSFMQNIPDVVELMQKLKPKRILDIGIGNGKYGLLAHEYIDGCLLYTSCMLLLLSLLS